MVRRFYWTGERVDQLSCINIGMDWVARLLSSHTVLVFHGNKMVIKDFAQNRILCELECGGGHRSWDIMDMRKVVFIKDKKIYTRELSFQGEVESMQGTHSQAINAVITFR